MELIKKISSTSLLTWESNFFFISTWESKCINLLLFLHFLVSELLSGGHNPSYMYRLIADYYSADDLVVKQRPTTGNW